MNRILVFLVMTALAFIPVVTSADGILENGVLNYPTGEQGPDKVVFRLSANENTDFLISPGEKIKIEISSKDCKFILLFEDGTSRKGCIDGESIAKKFRVQALDDDEKITVRAGQVP